MKRSLLALLLLATTSTGFTQSFSINTDGSPADTSAILDIKSSTKGVLVPRMTKTERNAIIQPATGLLIFQIGPDSTGFQYFDGTKWILIGTGSASLPGWSIAGNSGLTDDTHFIGTIDNTPLNFRLNNQPSGRFDASVDNYFIGQQAGNKNATGSIAIGAASAPSSTGAHNTALGHHTLATNTTGTGNTAIGYQADVAIATLNNATAIGSHAYAGQDNSIVLGGIYNINGSSSDTHVGIGTSTPDSLFSIADSFMVNRKGEIQFRDGVSNMMYMYQTPGTNPIMVISHSPGLKDWGLQYLDNGDKFNFVANGNYVQTIDLSNRRVGIANLNPQSTLHVGTGTGARLQIGNFETIEDFGSNLLGVSANFVPTASDAWNLGNASYRWKEIFSTNGVINTSDERQKKNITRLPYGLPELMKLRPVRYEWKNDDGSGPKLGFLAQDLVKIIPEVVKTRELLRDEKTGKSGFQPAPILGVYYTDLIPLTVKAIQEQEAVIQKMQKQLDEQQQLINELIKRMEKSAQR